MAAEDFPFSCQLVVYSEEPYLSESGRHHLVEIVVYSQEPYLSESGRHHLVEIVMYGSPAARLAAGRGHVDHDHLETGDTSDNYG